jgi:hypothetical protein
MMHPRPTISESLEVLLVNMYSTVYYQSVIRYSTTVLSPFSIQHLA